MRKQQLKKQIMVTMAIIVQVLFSPVGLPTTVTVSAQEAPIVEQTLVPTEPVPEVVPPVPEPVKYTYDPTTGLWSNGTYTWDPNSNTSSPVGETGYSYNPETNHWDTSAWAYDPNVNNYAANTPKVQQPIATIESTGPDSTNSIDNPLSPASISNTGPGSNNTTNGGFIQQTGPNSSNTIHQDPLSDIFFNGFFDAKISVSVTASARTGDALVVGNTIGGNAKSGDASSYTTILNLLQSGWGLGSAPNLFVANIDGNHFGDLVVDPGSIAKASTPTGGDLTVVVSESAAIHNDVDLSATSGNAKVADNTIGGNATSGDAYAVANLLNFINSSVSADQSFVAILNVLGNLDGDVLLPPDIAKQLLAANTPSTVLSSNNGQHDVDIDTNYFIDNNLDAQATSGSAAVANNTQGGNATSGNAETSVRIFNMTGQQVVAENSMLVFVNVLGEWIGFITNTPVGSTTSLLGACGTCNSDTSYDVDRDFSIVNDVSVKAKTGDATVSGNTMAGDATTGDAYAAINTMNIMNSSLTMSGWFGVFFINVFGNWAGSFGTDTASGGYSTGPKGGGDGGVITAPAKPAVAGQEQVKVFALSSTSNNSVKARPIYRGSNNTPPPAQVAEEAPQTLAAIQESPAEIAITPASGSNLGWYILVGGMGILLVIGWRRYVAAQNQTTIAA